MKAGRACGSSSRHRSNSTMPEDVLRVCAPYATPPPGIGWYPGGCGAWWTEAGSAVSGLSGEWRGSRRHLEDAASLFHFRQAGVAMHRSAHRKPLGTSAVRRGRLATCTRRVTYRVELPSRAATATTTNSSS